jgi:hypothetical protein
MYKKYLLIAVYSIMFLIVSAQKTSESTLADGSEKPILVTCSASCKYYFSKYEIQTRETEDEVGEKIIVVNKITNRKYQITDIEECYFYGIYKNYMLLSCGTDVIRNLSIYDLNRKMFVDFKISGGVFAGGYISNGKLFMDITMSGEKIKKLKLKDKKCETQICGYFEKVYYDFNTGKIIYTGEYKWME